MVVAPSPARSDCYRGPLGVQRGHRGLTAIEDDGGVALGDDRIDPGEDIGFGADRQICSASV